MRIPFTFVRTLPITKNAFPNFYLHPTQISALQREVREFDNFKRLWMAGEQAALSVRIAEAMQSAQVAFEYAT